MTMCMSMAIAQIKQESNVSEAYFAALKDALEGGFGWLWVRNPPLGGTPQSPASPSSMSRTGTRHCSIREQCQAWVRMRHCGQRLNVQAEGEVRGKTPECPTFPR